MDSITTKSGEIYYSQIGNKEAKKTLIFIPGSGMTAEFMEKFSTHFLEYNTITVELPGHGKSTGEISKSVEELTGYIEEAIRVLYAQKVATEDITVLGYSLGGFVAVSLGLIDMPQIKKIVVISSCADLSTNTLAGALQRMSAMTTISAEQIYGTMVGSATGEEKRGQIQNMFLGYLSSLDVLLKDLYSAKAFNIMDKVTSINQSMLVVIGDEDHIIQKKEAEHLAEAVKDAKIIEYKGFGHAMLFENTDQVVKDIKGFIN